MMMLDDLCTRLRNGKVLVPPLEAKQVAADFISNITQAEKFDFGDLPLEAGGDNLGGFKLPELTSDEREWWFTGLIPVPAPVCWYEFKLNNITSGLLVKREDDGRVWVSRCENTFIDDVWVHWAGQEEALKIVFRASQNALKAINKTPQEKVMQMWGSNGHLAAYLTLMINSKSSDVQRVAPSKDSNRLRRQLNKLPLSNYTRVVIVPQRFLRQAEEATGHSSPKRLHWRRSHLRVLHRGLLNEHKVVISRHLVGKRELGEITHDCYEVRMK